MPDNLDEALLILRFMGEIIAKVYDSTERSPTSVVRLVPKDKMEDSGAASS
jgi:hypothetical protein